MDPFLLAWSQEGGATGKRVVWAEHTDDPSAVGIASGSAVRRAQLKFLQEGGAEAIELTVPTHDLLTHLLHAWRIQPIATRPRSVNVDSSRWTGSDFVDDAKRRELSMRLFNNLGATRLVARLLPQVSLPPSERHFLAAEIAWARGRYRVARAEYKQAMPGIDAQGRLVRRERVAATHWVQGRLLLATVLLVQAISCAQRDGVDPYPAADTLLNVFRHLQMSPETRPFARRALQRWALSMLPSADQRLGTHLDTRYEMLRVQARDDLRHVLSAADLYERSIKSFAEYGALAGVVNFEHGQLASRIDRGESVRPEDYWKLRRHARALGRTESVHKATLLRGSRAVYSPALSAVAVLRLQITWWHRARLFSVSQLPVTHGKTSLSETG